MKLSKNKWSKEFKYLLIFSPFLFFAGLIAFLSISYGDYSYLIGAILLLILGIFISAPSTSHKKQININFKLFNRKVSDKSSSEMKKKKKPPLKGFKKIFFNLTTLLELAGLVILISIWQVYILQDSKDSNLFKLILNSHLNTLRENPIWLKLLLALFLVLFLVNFFTKRNKSNLIKFKKSLLQSILVVISSIVISLPTLFLLGLFNVNLISLRIANKPSSAGLFWDSDQIQNKLKEMDSPPQIIGSETDYKSSVLSLLIENKSTTGDFYNNYVIQKIPSQLILPIAIPKSSIYLIDNKLLVSSLEKEIIEKITPTIGKLLVKKDLEPRYIKDEPSITVMGRQEYLKYRETQINQDIADIDTQISDTQSAINYIYGVISQSESNIALANSYKQNAIAQRDSDYQYCLTAGYYSWYFGTFYRYYSDQQCENEKNEWNSIISGYDSNIAENQQSIQYSRSYLPDLESALDDLNYVRELLANNKLNTPQELGLFESPAKISVVLEKTNTESLADYFSTVTHEYLHYTSYVSEERVLPRFFEEALTEYFSRKTIEGQLNISTNQGYPLFIPIVETMMNDIPEETFEDIYFNKDEAQLIALLNDEYGDSFYEDSELFFFLLPFVDNRSGLKYANNILFRIGGDKLSESDIYSSNSEF